ncbi:MAG: tetratricopeptide repeat protein [Candidatus Brocadiia bacterium]
MDPPPTGRSRRSARAAWAAAVALLAVGTFAPSLGFGFLNWDDPDLVTESPRVTDFSPLELLSRPGPAYLPVRDLVYNLLWRAVGPWPPAFHGAVVAAHAAASVLFFLVLLEVLGRERLVAAGLGAAVFAVHPVHVEAVAWVSGLKEPLSAALAFAALVLWLRAVGEWGLRVRAPRGWRPAGLHVASLVLFWAACLAKASAVVLPGLMVACVLARRGRRRGWLPLVVPHAALGLVLAWLAAAAGRVAGAVAVRTEPAGAVVLTMARVVASYVRQLLVPWGLSPRYEVTVLRSLAQPQAWAGLAVAGAFLAAALWAWVRRRELFFALAWSVVALVPYLGLVPIGTLRADRYLYVACGGYAVVLGLAAEATLRGRARGRLVTGAFWAVLLAVYAGTSVWQSRFWASSERLWERALHFAPDDSVAHYLLGEAVLADAPQRAAAHFRRAVTERLEARERRRQAAREARARGHDDAARRHEAAAAEHRDAAADALAYYGTALRQLGDLEAALDAHARALELGRGKPRLHYHVAADLHALGRWDDATIHYLSAARGDDALTEQVARDLAGLARSLRREGKERASWAVANALLRLAAGNPAANRVLDRLRREAERQRPEPRSPGRQ